MVEVYRTNVRTPAEAQFLLKYLNTLYPVYEMNFDLEDCDRILRVETALDSIDVTKIILVLKDLGFTAQILSDFISVTEYSVLDLICYPVPGSKALPIPHAGGD
ncbi:hypothetical protein [Dyadobacter tibetensis]|uniref:hypothetical protein n=1 Tax=Dyadobacter tibetensis TaxID=1211851 RepID=UPI00046EC608|nr:hypothetical protein [Dyadobacter tibetensis]